MNFDILWISLSFHIEPMEHMLQLRSIPKIPSMNRQIETVTVNLQAEKYQRYWKYMDI